MTRIFAPGKAFSFVIELRPLVFDKNNSVSGPVIGVLGMTVDSKTSFATIGYCLSPEHWGRGYLTDALSAFMSSYWDTHPNGLPGIKYEGKGGRSLWKRWWSLGIWLV
jgi:RimJ/RimL family protein N-acetyltransferase